MSPPEWALLEREVLDASGAAESKFYNQYFDERGYLLHVARWGALDGSTLFVIPMVKAKTNNYSSSDGFVSIE